MRIGVAASGGRDSTALLHCVWRAAAPLGIDVVALHVHHGLVAEADGWVAHLKAQTARWSRAGPVLTLDVTHLTDRPGRGESVEAWARRERYAALAAMARRQGCDAVMLAHHRRDQAETVLLQALRGAGAAGLAAMPRSTERDGIRWYRPWLDMPHAAIATYVQRWHLSHIDDSSNADERFARNRLRRRVWPVLVDAFPQAELSLSQAALRAQDERAALQSRAEQDADALEAPRRSLPLDPWRKLTPARQQNLLLHWLRDAELGPVPGSLVRRLMLELPKARQGSWPWSAEHRLALHRGNLAIVPTATALPPAGVAASPRDVSRPGSYRFDGWRGVLQVASARSGLSVADLRAVVPRPREGREQFRLQAGAADRSLKKQFQALAVPVWQRSGPLLFDTAGRLLFVPGLGIDARVSREPRHGLRQLSWQCDDPGPSGSPG